MSLLKVLVVWLGLSAVALAAEPTDIHRELTMITSSSIPPYVMAEENRGIVVDLIREALAFSGYRVRFIYSTNKRLEAELLSRRVDGAYNFPAGEWPGLYTSESIIDYQNVVVTLASRNLRIEGVDDLAGLRVAAFQNSALFLGEAYGAMSAANPHHEELSNQKSQVYMLYRGYTDAIVLDARIFQHYFQVLERELFLEPNHRFHNLFPPASRHALFVDKDIRDRFDAGLRQLRSMNRYDAIVQRYIHPDEAP